MCTPNSNRGSPLVSLYLDYDIHNNIRIEVCRKFVLEPNVRNRFLIRKIYQILVSLVSKLTAENLQKIWKNRIILLGVHCRLVKIGTKVGNHKLKFVPNFSLLRRLNVPRLAIRLISP